MAVYVGTWSIGAGMMGSQSLNLHLTVGTSNGVVYGQAEMYYDFPGKSFHSAVVGHVSKGLVPGTGDGYIFNLNGSMPVASGPENLRLTMTLGPAMKTGLASYTYLDNEKGWLQVSNEKVVYQPPSGPDVYTNPSEQSEPDHT